MLMNAVGPTHAILLVPMFRTQAHRCRRIKWIASPHLRTSALIYDVAKALYQPLTRHRDLDHLPNEQKKKTII